MFEIVKGIYQKIHHTQQKILSLILLHVVFLLGLGVTRLVMKIFGHSLFSSNSTSSWKPHRSSLKLKNLF